MRNESITSGLASRRLRVVLDTNQFVSALIRTGGLQDRLIGAWADGRFVAVISPLLLDELRNVIRRPRLVERYETFCAIRPRNAEDPRQHYISGRFIHHVPKINADAYGHRLSAIVRALSRKTSHISRRAGDDG